MNLKVTIKFNEQERQAVLAFCHQIGMGTQEFCKRAVFYSINHAYKRAEVMQQSQEGTGDARTVDVDSQPPRNSSEVDSNVLAEEASPATDNGTSTQPSGT